MIGAAKVSVSQAPNPLWPCPLFSCSRMRWKEVLMPLLPPRGAGFIDRKKSHPQGWSLNTSLVHLGWWDMQTLMAFHTRVSACWKTHPFSSMGHSFNFLCQLKYRLSTRPENKRLPVQSLKNQSSPGWTVREMKNVLFPSSQDVMFWQNGGKCSTSDERGNKNHWHRPQTVSFLCFSPPRSPSHNTYVCQDRSGPDVSSFEPQSWLELIGL